jgi:hypothetical protein
MKTTGNEVGVLGEHDAPRRRVEDVAGGTALRGGPPPVAAAVLHPQRVEDRLAEPRLVGLPGDLLDDLPEGAVADVAVVEALPGRVLAGEARRNFVRGVFARPCSTFAKPWPFEWTTAPSRRTTTAVPGHRPPPAVANRESIRSKEPGVPSPDAGPAAPARHTTARQERLRACTSGLLLGAASRFGAHPRVACLL